MKRILTIMLIAGAVMCSSDMFAQDGGKKDKKKKKKEQKEAAPADSAVDLSKDDSPSPGGPSEITIDEAGTGRSKTPAASTNKTDTTSNTTPVPTGLERPAEETPAPAPKEEQTSEAASPAPEESGSPAPPAGASGLDAGGSGTSLTIDEAGTQKVKSPTQIIGDGLNGGAAPESLTIDEAGTGKSKKATTTTTTPAPSTATDTTTAAPTTVKEQVKEEIKEEVKEEVKEKGKEKTKEAGGKVIDMIKPKQSAVRS